MERNISTPWMEQGCTFRVIPNTNGYELQRRKHSNVWEFVKQFPNWKEVNYYLDELGNAPINLSLETSAAFLIIDACSQYKRQELLTQHEDIVLRRVIQWIKNNMTI